MTTTSSSYVFYNSAFQLFYFLVFGGMKIPDVSASLSVFSVMASLRAVCGISLCILSFSCLIGFFKDN